MMPVPLTSDDLPRILKELIQKEKRLDEITSEQSSLQQEIGNLILEIESLLPKSLIKKIRRNEK